MPRRRTSGRGGCECRGATRCPDRRFLCQRVEHGEHGSHADAGADQQYGGLRLVEDERATRRCDVEQVADGESAVEVAAGGAVALALDRDPVVAGVGQPGEGLCGAPIRAPLEGDSQGEPCGQAARLFTSSFGAAAESQAPQTEADPACSASSSLPGGVTMPCFGTPDRSSDQRGIRRVGDPELHRHPRSRVVHDFDHRQLVGVVAGDGKCSGMSLEQKSGAGYARSAALPGSRLVVVVEEAVEEGVDLVRVVVLGFVPPRTRASLPPVERASAGEAARRLLREFFGSPSGRARRPV